MEQKELITVDGGDFLPTSEQQVSIINVIAEMATNPNVNIEVFERLVSLQERVMDKKSAQEFSAAFAKMQSELPEIEHDKAINHNGKRISTYAKFETINETVKPILKKYGFGVSFRTEQTENRVTVTGILSHEAGHHEKTSITLPLDLGGAKTAVQAVGSAISYGKRYVLCALLNISTRGEDDESVISEKRVTQPQAKMIESMLAKLPANRQAAFAEKYGAPSDVRKGQFQTIIATLRKESNDDNS